MSPVRRIARGVLRRLVNKLAPPEAVTALRFLGGPSNPIFPKRNVQVVATVPQAKVLVLSPHPDDEAIGMGGTLAMHVANGSEVAVLYLTDGGGIGEEGEERRELVRTRRAEAEAAGRDLGIRQIFWDQRDTKLTNDARTVDALVELLREMQPSFVYPPSFFDSHHDHFATNQVLVDALGVLPRLEASVAGYEVWDTIPFANYLVDVSAVIENKDAMLAHYATPHRYTDFTDLCRHRAAVHFTLHVDSERRHVGKGFAEAFLRFDAATYRELHLRYVRALRADRSEQPAHLQASQRRI